MRDHEFWLIDQGVHMVQLSSKFLIIEYQIWIIVIVLHGRKKFAFGLSWTRAFWYYWTCLRHPWFLHPHFVHMYTWMEIRQSCAWIDDGILSRVTGKCCFNFIRNPESTGNVVGSRRFAQAAPKVIFNLGKPAVWFRNPRDQATIRDARFYISAQEASYCAILSHAAKAAAKRRFWCRQSQLTFRTMKSTSAVHLPTAKSPSSIFAGEPVDGQTFVPLNSKRNSLTHIFSWYHLASVFVILHIFLKLSINCRLPISPYEIRQFCWFVFKNSDLARP